MYTILYTFTHRVITAHDVMKSAWKVDWSLPITQK
ncbi:hypothetical protein J2067_000489 [Erwinia rhapontici]|nr:hypothetical protein [Erwinia rhapontici]